MSRKEGKERERERERFTHHPTPPSQPLDPTYFNSFPLLRLNNLRLFRTHTYIHELLQISIELYILIKFGHSLTFFKLLRMIFIIN